MFKFILNLLNFVKIYEVQGLENRSDFLCYAEMQKGHSTVTINLLVTVYGFTSDVI